MTVFNSGLSFVLLVTHPDVAIQKNHTGMWNYTAWGARVCLVTVPLRELGDQPQVNFSNAFAVSQVGSLGKMHEVTENFLYELHLKDLLGEKP